MERGAAAADGAKPTAQQVLAQQEEPVQSALIDDLLAAIDKPFAFIDIGANQGLFSLVAARNPNCQKIVALEPVPTTYAKLQANLALNGLDDRADAISGSADEPEVDLSATNYDETDILFLLLFAVIFWASLYLPF